MLLRKGSKASALGGGMLSRMRTLYIRLGTVCMEDHYSSLPQPLWKALRDVMRAKPGPILDYATGVLRPPS